MGKLLPPPTEVERLTALLERAAEVLTLWQSIQLEPHKLERVQLQEIVDRDTDTLLTDLRARAG